MLEINGDVAVIAVGIAFIIIGVSILMVNIQDNQFSAFGYANRDNFWYFRRLLSLIQ